MTNTATDADEPRRVSDVVPGWHTVRRTQNDDDPGTARDNVAPTPGGEPMATVMYSVTPSGQGTPGSDVKDDSGSVQSAPDEGSE